MSVQSLVNELIYTYGGITGHEYFFVFKSFINLCFLIIYYIPVFIYFCKIIQTDLYKILFVFLTTFSYAYVPHSIQVYTGIFYNNLPAAYETSVIIRNIVYVLISIFSFFTIGWFIKRFLSSHLRVATVEEIKKICIIPVIFFAVIWLNEEFYYADIVTEATRGFFIFLLFLLTVLSAYIYLVIFQMHNIARESKKAEFQLKQSRGFNKMLEKRYSAIQAHIIKTRQAEHDLRHHFSVIKSYILSEDNIKLNLYLDEYISSLPYNSEKRYL